jgi:hypothetical protein
VRIPGPLRPFLRMAGISQKVSNEDVIPLLAHNVFALGYTRGGARTEFLILLTRYVQQARELEALARPDGIIHVSTCEEAKPLLETLGYRTRAGCGQHSTFLETRDSRCRTLKRVSRRAGLSPTLSRRPAYLRCLWRSTGPKKEKTLTYWTRS